MAQMDHKALRQVGTAQHWVAVQQSLQLVAVTVQLVMAVLVATVALVVEALLLDLEQQVRAMLVGLLPTMSLPVRAGAQEQQAA
jgi:hypothetical protein